MNKRIEVQKLYLQLFSMTNDGMHLEICQGTNEGELAEGEPYPIALIRTESEGKLILIIETSSGTVSMPLSEFERAISVAHLEVHCEEYYDNNELDT